MRTDEERGKEYNRVDRRREREKREREERDEGQMDGVRQGDMDGHIAEFKIWKKVCLAEMDCDAIVSGAEDWY